MKIFDIFLIAFISLAVLVFAINSFVRISDGDTSIGYVYYLLTK